MTNREEDNEPIRKQNREPHDQNNQWEQDTDKGSTWQETRGSKEPHDRSIAKYLNKWYENMKLNQKQKWHIPHSKGGTWCLSETPTPKTNKKV